MTEEKIPPNANDRPEPVTLEQLSHLAPPPQIEAGQADQQTAPLRRPLFRT